MMHGERITALLSFVDSVEPFSPSAVAAFRPCASDLKAGDRDNGQVLTRVTALGVMPAIPDGRRMQGYYERIGRNLVAKWHSVVGSAGGDA